MTMTEEMLERIEKEALEQLEFADFRVRKRNGEEVEFDPVRIQSAIEAAFKAYHNLAEDEPLSLKDQEAAVTVTRAVIREVVSRAKQGEGLEIEIIQDAVESELMEKGHYKIARLYIVYREERRRARSLLIRGRDLDDEDSNLAQEEGMIVVRADGGLEHLEEQRIRRALIQACRGFGETCDWKLLAEDVMRQLYNRMPVQEIDQALMMAARSRIETEPDYGFVASRLLRRKLYKEVWQSDVMPHNFEGVYRAGFANYLEFAIATEHVSPELREFDIGRLSMALDPERDEQFNYLGMQTIYDRYLITHNDRRIETPQYFWMRVSMGLAINEGEHKTDRAIEFYNLLSSFRFISSTPTLFNSGTLHPQLSSCYLLTIDDDLNDIFKIISDDAALSKWAGGLGNDWSNIRATGAYIKGTNGRSQGIIPFMKVANDTAVAVNQGGKRKGAMCAYLETWHLDLEDFLELRKNTGDERRRTHDMHTANWIPDLFMKRVRENGTWTLFSPSDVPDLHDKVGLDFEEAYTAYEQAADEGRIKLHKRMNALDLWRKMITALFETGHPWITFKDPSNIRSPQQHVGVVHSSNLCTEILLNTSKEEQAVCNLGSVNLVRHIKDGKLDAELLQQTIRTALRMLDNVIDINFYPTAETRHANMRHRPVGLGMMGFQDALYLQGLSYDSEAAVEFADRSMEAISYYAILSSTELAAERGAYQTFRGSLWDQGFLPIDSIDLLERQRGGFVTQDRSTSLDWDRVREAIRTHGMRNSNVMAIAPTATISNVCGVSQSIEPAYKQLFVKSNLSGEFTVVNPYLVDELKRRDLWDREMIDDLKYFDGSLQEIERIPEDVRAVFKCAFEIEPTWLIECASRRQKWIDMGQSLNLYIAEASGRKLSEMYQLAWEKGLKTTYYLRAMAATQIEKSTTDVNKRGLQPRWMKSRSASADVQVEREQGAGAPEAPALDDRPLTPPSGVQQCSIDDPDCEACQ